MEAKRLQGWWLAACVIALLLAYWAGGFSLVATFIFVVIYLTGATLIGRDEDTEDAGEAGDTQDTQDTENTENTDNAGAIEAEDAVEAETGDDAEAIAETERSS
jgi:hypothetical protein